MIITILLPFFIPKPFEPEKLHKKTVGPAKCLKYDTDGMVYPEEEEEKGNRLKGHAHIVPACFTPSPDGQVLHVNCDVFESMITNLGVCQTYNGKSVRELFKVV